MTSQRAGAGRVKRTLRMFLSNTTTRPGSSTGAGTDASAGGDRPEPGFVMRLEGRLLDVSASPPPLALCRPARPEGKARPLRGLRPRCWRADSFVRTTRPRRVQTGNPRHDKFPKRKFSSFISSIIVELPPDVYPAPSNTIEVRSPCPLPALSRARALRHPAQD